MNDEIKLNLKNLEEEAQSIIIKTNKLNLEITELKNNNSEKFSYFEDLFTEIRLTQQNSIEYIEKQRTLLSDIITILNSHIKMIEKSKLFDELKNTVINKLHLELSKKYGTNKIINPTITNVKTSIENTISTENQELSEVKLKLLKNTSNSEALSKSENQNILVRKKPIIQKIVKKSTDKSDKSKKTIHTSKKPFINDQNFQYDTPERILTIDIEDDRNRGKGKMKISQSPINKDITDLNKEISYLETNSFNNMRKKKNSQSMHETTLMSQSKTERNVITQNSSMLLKKIEPKFQSKRCVDKFINLSFKPKLNTSKDISKTDTNFNQKGKINSSPLNKNLSKSKVNIKDKSFREINLKNDKSFAKSRDILDNSIDSILSRSNINQVIANLN